MTAQDRAEGLVVDGAAHQPRGLDRRHGLRRDQRVHHRIRRLCEYLGYERRGRIEASLKEHLSILESVLDGDMQWASAQLRRHLQKWIDQTRKHFSQDMVDFRSGARHVELAGQS